MAKESDAGTGVREPSELGRADQEGDITEPRHLRGLAVRAVAHRVRTPLSVVISAIHSARAADLDERLRRELDVALEQSELVVADIDELSEIGRWTDELDLRPERLGELLAEAGLLRLARFTWHGLTYSIDPVDTAEVDLDAARMGWALDVLVRHALQRSGATGHITLRCEEDGDEVVASIEVHSEGFADVPDARPCRRVASEIVALHGGTIHHSEHGSISREEVRVPLQARGSSARRESVDAPAVAVRSQPGSDEGPVIVGPGEAPLVLIVEDDAVLRGFLADQLSIDHRVVTAASAEDALRVVDLVRPDLITCDLLLPGAGGDQLVHQLHADPALADIPIIVVSGRSDDAQRVRILRGGADDYLTKPFSSDELRARITNLLSKHLDADDLRERAAHADAVANQLQQALDSRVVIEQAKAFVAADRGIDVEDAFEVMRRYARSHNIKLRDLAAAIVDGFRP